MTPEQIAENVKRLRRIKELEWIMVDQEDAIQTINALVQMVGEMEKTLEFYTWNAGERGQDFLNRMEEDSGTKADLILNKAAHIAQLAKGEK